MDKLLTRILGLLVMVCIIMVADAALAASTEKLIKKGNFLFSSGKFDDAISAYDEAALNDPESPVIYYNRGTALYKKQDFANARDAFHQVAIKTKDINLEAKSRFNLGLCLFREGERQKDSDLKKALESYGASVQSFQEALDLDPEFTEAAENIELVRLMMKSVLDEMKKQEEAAQKQQEQARQTAEAIKKLIEQQKDLLDETKARTGYEQPEKAADAAAVDRHDKNAEQLKEIAAAQEQLKNDTQTLSDQLATPASPPGAGTPPASEHPSKPHLEASVKYQGTALENFSNNDPRTAADHQQQSLANLNKALDALSGGEENQPSGQQQQAKNKAGQNDASAQDEDSQSPADKANQPQSEKPEPQPPDTNQAPSAAIQQTDDADKILDEEKENKKNRMPVTSGGFKKVDKDW